MMSEQSVLNETQIVNIGLPFTPDLTQAYDTQPIFRLQINLYESSSLGLLELGYYIKVNESVYFIRKKAISVFTNTQTERVLQFLKKTQREFIISVKRDKTNSGHQYVQFDDIDFNNGIYTLIDFKVFRSLWQIIEFKLYEKSNFPSIARFTDDRLIWYAKLLPKHSLVFTDVAKITLNEVAKQGHLKVYKIEKDEQFTFPYYLYKTSESLRFFNHEIHQKLDVIPLGSERRIISIPKEAQIVSDDHDPITLPEGLYLLFHPRPQDRVD
jgi:hypothetical protein